MLGIRLGARTGVGADVKRKSASIDGKEAFASASMSENGHVDFLPPLRPPSPLWAGSFGKVCIPSVGRSIKKQKA